MAILRSIPNGFRNMDSKMKVERPECTEKSMREKPLRMVFRDAEIFDSTCPWQVSKGEGYKEEAFTVEGIMPFYLDHARTKGRLVRLGSQIDKLLKKHNYPPFINRYVAEIIALAATLSVDAKYEGVFTLQVSTQPDHPSLIRLLVVDINTQGHVRAYAQWDEELLDKTIKQNNSLEEISLQEIFGKAFIVFTADLAEQVERYQAIVELSGKTLAESMHHFFRQSDQVPTGLVLYSQTHPEKDHLIAGALILQRLPSQTGLPLTEIEKQEDDWITNLSLMGTLTKNELLDAHLSNEKLLYRLFHERNLHFLTLKPLVAQCSCSKERLSKILDNFPLLERKQMAVNGEIKAVCEFCNTEYAFEI